MSYFVAPLQQVKTSFPEFAAAMASLEQAVRARAESAWVGYTFGGLQPGANQYGLANLLPRHLNMASAFGGFGSWSFMHKFTTPGSWSNIFSYNVPSNQIHGYAGFSIISATNPFTALRVQLTDTILPIFEIEESRGWDPGSNVGIIIKTDQGKELVQNENGSVLLKGFAERQTTGFNVRVVPIGMMAYKARDDLINVSGPSV